MSVDAFKYLIFLLKVLNDRSAEELLSRNIRNFLKMADASLANWGHQTGYEKRTSIEIKRY